MTSKKISAAGAAIARKALWAANKKVAETESRIAEISAAKAIEYLDEQRRKERESRYDRRLHNTQLLLENYQILKKHTEDAVYSSAIVKENAIDILDSLDTYVMSDGVYVQTIRQSQQRTLIIVRHIDKMFELFKAVCEGEGKPESIRRYNIIYDRYLAPERKKVKDIARDFHIDNRTVYKDIEAGIKPLSALIFGVDSIDIH